MHWWQGIGAVILLWSFFLGLVYRPELVIGIVCFLVAVGISIFIFFIAAGG